MAKKKKEVKEKNIKANSKADDSKTYAFLATFLSIIGFVIALVTKKDDEYVMYYAKQSLVIFIIAVIAGIINSILMWIPFLGWFIIAIINIALFLLWLVSWIYALSGEKKTIPIVSDYAQKFKF
jgi:uncharacterized membrane protein